MIEFDRDVLSQLTERQKTVAILMAHGFTNSQMARLLRIGEGRLGWIRVEMYQRLNVTNSAQMVARVVKDVINEGEVA